MTLKYYERPRLFINHISDDMLIVAPGIGPAAVSRLLGIHRTEGRKIHFSKHAFKGWICTYLDEPCEFYSDEEYVYVHPHLVFRSGRIYNIIRQEDIRYSLVGHGYQLSCSIVLGERYVHRIVYKAFYGEIFGDINHKDRNRENNCLSNLEDVSKSENSQHFYNSHCSVPYGARCQRKHQKFWNDRLLNLSLSNKELRDKYDEINWHVANRYLKWKDKYLSGVKMDLIRQSNEELVYD